MNLIAINRKTGMRAARASAGTIIEAFKPGTGPADSYWVIGMGADGSNGAGGPLSPQANQAIQDRRRPLLSGANADVGWPRAGPFRFTGGGAVPMYRADRKEHSATGQKPDHARGNAEYCRRDQAGDNPAEEASLTGIRP